MRRISKFLLGTIALFIMLLGLSVCTFADAPTQYITESISIDAFSSPKIGWLIPSAEDTGLFSIKESDKFHLKEVNFYESVVNDVIRKAPTTFTATVPYTIEFVIEAEPGYYFQTSRQTCYGIIDGKTESFTIAAKTTETYDSKTYTTAISCKYKFEDFWSDYTNYGVSVAKNIITSESMHDCLGYYDKGSTVTYDPDSDTLSMNGMIIEDSLIISSTITISSDKLDDDEKESSRDNFNINITDANAIIAENIYAIQVSGVDVNISGDGSLMLWDTKSEKSSFIYTMYSYYTNSKFHKLTLSDSVKVTMVNNGVNLENDTLNAFRWLKSLVIKDNASLLISTFSNKKDDTTNIGVGYIESVIVQDKGMLAIDSIDSHEIKTITYSGKKKALWGTSKTTAKEIASGTDISTNPNATYLTITNKTYATSITSIKNEANGITIKWNKKTDADGYIVYRKNNSSGKYEKVVKLEKNTVLTYTDKDVTEGQEYSYYVTTYCNAKDWGLITESKESEIKTIPRVKSCTIKAATNVSNGIQVTFTKNPVATKYMLFRRTIGNGWTTGWTWLKNTTSLTCIDTTAESGKTYEYCVIPCKDKDAYQGYKSKEFQVKCVATPKVTVVKVTNGIKVSWGKIAGATKYQVFRKTIGNGWESGWTWLKDTTSLYYTDTTAKAGVTYCYAVKAFSNTTQSGVGKSTTIKR